MFGELLADYRAALAEVRRRPTPPLTYTLSIDTERIDAAFGELRRSIEGVARRIGETLGAPVANFADEARFRLYARRSGEHVCAGHHEALTTTCVYCGAST